MNQLYREELSNGQIKYRWKTNPNARGTWVSQKDLVSRAQEIITPLKKTIMEYLEQKNTEKLSKLSHNGVLQPDLTDLLREQKLICPKEEAYIAGNGGIHRILNRPESTGFQVRIGRSENKLSVNSWFIWNFGNYGGRSADKGSITLMDRVLFFKDEKIIRI